MNPEREQTRNNIIEMLQAVYMLRGMSAERAQREATLMVSGFEKLHEERLQDIQKQRDDFNSGKVTP